MMAPVDETTERLVVVVNATAVHDWKAVELCLDAIDAQSLTPGEVVLLVANDGGAPTDRRACVVAVSPHEAFAKAFGATSGDAIAWIDADRVPARGWLEALTTMVVSTATAVVVGRTIDDPGDDVAARWRAVHRSHDLGDLPMVGPRNVRGGNALIRRNRVRALIDTAVTCADPIASIARGALGAGLTVRHAPEAIATRTTSQGIAYEIERWRDDGGLDVVLDRSRRAICADLAGRRHDLGYVSLLAGLLSACRAGIAPDAIRRALSRPGIVPEDVGRAIAADVDVIRHEGGTGAVSTRAPGVEASLTQWVDDLPRAGWRRLLSGRRVVAAAQGWALLPDPVGTTVAPEAWWPTRWRVAARALPAMIPGLVAVIATGRPGTPASEASFLLVTREEPDPDALEAWAHQLNRATGVRCRLDAVASDALGWLAPSLAVVDAFANAVCLWGDPGVVDVIPAWLPSAIPFDEALSVIGEAHVALDTGDAALARRSTMQALLVARGAYDPNPGAHGRALASAWPEIASAMSDMPATVAVAHAQIEMHRLRFVWEGEGPGAAAIGVWLSLRDAWRPRSGAFMRATGDSER